MVVGGCLVMDKYVVLELIGEGSFGKVYKGRKKWTKQVCGYFSAQPSQPSPHSPCVLITVLLFYVDGGFEVHCQGWQDGGRFVCIAT